MKKGELIKRIKAQGCIFVKHGKKHDVYRNPRTGAEERIPRHNEINEILAGVIIPDTEVYAMFLP